MEVHTFFLHLMVILLAARIFGEVATRLQIPSVVGELIAGIVLGPSLLGWLEPSEIVHLLAEIGIILLLFKVGLETDITRLAKAGGKSFAVAFVGFIVPFVLGFFISYSFFGLSVLVSLFIGGTLTATSIGITVRVLSDLRRQHSREAQIVLGAAVIDDVMGVIVLALLYEFSTSGGINLINTGKVIVFIAIFFMLAPIAAKLISLVIKRIDDLTHAPGLIPTTVVALVLFFAWLAHVIGAPELLGGFAAGLALSRRFFLPFGVAIHSDPEFAENIEKQMEPIVQLFTPIFFVMVGLSLDLSAVDWSSAFIWAFSLTILIVAITGKLMGGILINEPFLARVAVGMAMVPRGEVGLIFAELGRLGGVFNNEVHAALILVIAFTTFLPPFLMKWFYTRYGVRLESYEKTA
jgi:Kef-type K+ transport system membrane component KefB